MAKRVEFFFDYGSPYSYLADTQVTGLAERTGATLVHRPMLLGAVLKETGGSPMVPAKGRHLLVDLGRWAARYGVPFRPNPYFPINTLRLMRGSVAAELSGSFPAYHRAVFAAMWTEEKNLGDEATLRSVLAAAGIDAARLLGEIDTPAVKDRLRANTEEAVRRGAFGAPTFFVGDEMFWGNDRLPFVEEALRR
jgi:2-hydroxychromene-2-carboxylate isomerase